MQRLCVEEFTEPLQVEIVDEHVGHLFTMGPSGQSAEKEISRLRVFLMSKAGCSKEKQQEKDGWWLCQYPISVCLMFSFDQLSLIQ